MAEDEVRLPSGVPTLRMSPRTVGRWVRMGLIPTVVTPDSDLVEESSDEK